MKSTPSGHLLLQEAGTNDLVLMTAAGAEVTRVKASMHIEVGSPGSQSFPFDQPPLL